MKLPSGENNNNSVHPEWTVRVTSTPNCNLPCAQKKPNPTHKPVTWWDHMRAPACMPIPGINAYGIIPEHLPKDWTFCWSCTWCFCCFFFFLYYLLHRQYFLIPILIPSTFPPFPLPQSIVLPPNYYFCPFSSTLSLSSPLSPTLPQPLTTLPLPPTHSPLID
jgi:hypothetical protein